MMGSGIKRKSKIKIMIKKAFSLRGFFLTPILNLNLNPTLTPDLRFHPGK